MLGTPSSSWPFDPEIEKTARANRKRVRLAKEAARVAELEQRGREEEISEEEIEEMAENIQNPPPPPQPRRTLGDYGQRNNGEVTNLGFQPVNPVAFDIKNTVLSALKEDQYSGSESQCPNLHLSHFYEACDYTDPPGVSESDKRLRLFKHSLTGRAKDWLDTIPPNTINNWRELERKFLDRYFPIHKFLERRSEISNFEQGDNETLYDAWERFKLCLKKCPNHGFDDLSQMQMFTQGLRPQTRMILDASAGGSLKNRDETQARELIETMAQNEYRAQNDRGAKKKAGILELDAQSALLAQSKLMTNQMEAMLKLMTNASPQQAQANQVQEPRCDFCLQGHTNGGCFPEGSEEAKYLANFRKSYPNNNLGYGWGNTQGQGATQNPPPPRPPSRMEETLTQFMQMTQGNFEAMKKSQEVSNKNHEASIKNLEVQMGQLSRQFSSLQNNGGFGGNTHDNPKNESCKAINLRSREVPDPKVSEKLKKKNVSEGEVEKVRNGVVENESEIEEVVESDQEEVVEKQREKNSECEQGEDAKKDVNQETKDKGKGQESLPHVRVPYPRKKKVKTNHTHFKKFMKMFNSLQVNIPLAEALE
ncbi:hypothetical protein L195_g001633 [Trifolium pratense]|uniref:Retrotransposon gag domain-containing protein n=1 Tax=Trifolium pratense TaxID=57577 RepID=A0A2K3NQ73_TRIPR|nr:hypothetical protein L195_g001633 [Trifolium pratense]